MTTPNAIRAGVRVGITPVGSMTLDLELGQNKPVRLHFTVEEAAELFQAIGTYLERRAREDAKRRQIVGWQRELGVTG